MSETTRTRDHLQEYLSYLQVERGLAKNSLESYKRDLTKLQLWAENEDLDVVNLNRQDLRGFIAALSRMNLSPSSVSRIISAVRGFYKFLMLDGHIKKHPAEDLDTPQKGFYLPRFLSEYEIENLFSVPDAGSETGLRDRAILETMYASGLRVSEAVTLNIFDVDVDAGIVTCKGKGSKQRKVPLGKSAVEWLKKYLVIRRRKENVVEQNLFVTSLGKSLTRQTIFKLIKKHAEKVGLEDVSPHTLRHSFATHLMQHGADSRSVQAMLGHADISTTQIYTHMTDTHLRKTYEKFHPRARQTSEQAETDMPD
jgi:integrase/recombinase XerD